MTKTSIKSFLELPKIIAVDFDGTLCVNKFPNIGASNLTLIDKLIQKRKEGVKIVLWTCRTNNFTTETGDCINTLDQAVEWCKDLGLEFDAVNENIQEVKDLTGGNTRKVFADLYIDDKCCDVPFANVYGHMDIIDLVKSWNNLDHTRR